MTVKSWKLSSHQMSGAKLLAKFRRCRTYWAGNLRRFDLFVEKYPRLLAQLEKCFAVGERLTSCVRETLRSISYAQ
jgi:hypothetical protein